MNLMQISIYRLYIKMQIQFEFTIIDIGEILKTPGISHPMKICSLLSYTSPSTLLK